VKITLGMIVRNEEEMLKRTLPVLAPCFRWKYALDTGSTDGTKKLLKSFGFEVVDFDWQWDFSAARNRVIQETRALGADWLWFLDADEAMWPHDIARVKDCLDMGNAFGFPRWNLIYDRQHWESWSYPDQQNRLFRLNGEWLYAYPLHESLNSTKGEQPTFLKDAHIFHYGSVKPIKQVWLKHHNYNLLKQGVEPIERLPASIEEMPEDQFQMIYGAAAKHADDFPYSNPLGV
jgi:glycosyltransferase involved in cell wall biosynthesis